MTDFASCLRVKGLAVFTAALLPHAVLAQDWRAELGEDTARSIEQVVTAAYPGGTVSWRGKTEIVLADGTRNALVLPGFRTLRRGDENVVVSCLELEEKKRESVRSLDSHQAIRDKVEAKLVALRQGHGGAIKDRRVVVLQADAKVTECQTLKVVGWAPSDGRWPILQVEYQSMDGDTDWVGSIRWLATIDMATNAITERLPTLFSIRKPGEPVRMDALTTRRTGTRIEIVRATSSELVHACSKPCAVPAAVIWGLR